MEKSIHYSGKKIDYTIIGNRKPVMLVHGFAEDNTVWRSVMDELSTTYQLILPNLPGTAGSELLAETSMESMAAVLCAILDEEQITACPVIGHSMGGYITMAMADRYPQRVTAIGLFHSSAYADTTEKKTARKEGIRSIQNKGATAFLEKTIPNLFAPATRSSNPDLVASQVTSARHFTNASLVAYYEAMIERPDRRSALENTGIPVLFLIGKEDTAIPPGDMLQQAHLPRLAVVHTLQQSGHLGMLEEPVQSIRFVFEFLEIVEQPA